MNKPTGAVALVHKKNRATQEGLSGLLLSCIIKLLKNQQKAS